MIDINKMTVLIADDSFNMCQSISGMLKVVGYGGRFLFAHNGQEALDVLAKESVDLVLLDYNMPVMSGAEVLTQIRMDRRFRELPVIMVTAEAYRDYVAEMGESEIDAYILKPLTVKVLQEKVAQVIQKANNPPPMVAYLKEARRHEDEGDLESAIQAARKAAAENPKASRPLRELGYFHLKRAELDQAEKFLQGAVRRNYMDVLAFHYLGELYLERDDIAKAAHYLDKAMKISPRQLGRGIRFGKVLVQRSMLEKAREVFDKVLSLPAATPEVKEEVADFCLEHGFSSYGLKLMETLAEDQPRRADLCYKMGRVLLDEGEKLRAVYYLSRAADLDKTDIEVRLTLARLYLDMKKPLLAEKPLLQIMDIDRGNQEAQELLRKCS
ncbi:MAG: response regulator [Desulfobacteraceae bacterium]